MDDEIQKIIQLIHYDKMNSNYHLTYEGETFLKSLSKPFVLISIASDSSMHLSKIRNCLMNTSKSNHDSRGIKIWTEPIHLLSKGNMESIPIYLAEIENFNTNDQINHKMNLLIISLMISSYFLYVSYGLLEEKALIPFKILERIEEKLEMNIMKFPPLLWIIDEFPLILEDNLSVKEYFENKLNFFNLESHNINKIVGKLKNYFHKRDYIVIPKDNEPFIDSLYILLNDLITKHNNYFNKGGEFLSLYIKDALSKINRGEILNVENVWKKGIDKLSRSIIESCESLYDDILNKDYLALIKKENTLKEVHSKAVEKCLDYLNQYDFIPLEMRRSLTMCLKKKYKCYRDTIKKHLISEMRKELDSWYKSYQCNFAIMEKDERIETIDSIEKFVNGNEFNETNLKEIIQEYKIKALIFSLGKISNVANSYTENEINQVKENEIKDITEKYKEVIHQKDQSISKQCEKIEEIKKENLRFISELGRKSNDEKLREINMKYLNENLNYQNEVKILEQKIDLLNKMIEDINKREEQNSQIFKLQIIEQSKANKDHINKYEDAIKNIKKDNEEYKDKIMDLEYILKNKEMITSIEINKYEEINKNLIQNIELLNNKLIKAEEKLTEQKNLYERKYTEYERESNFNYDNLNIKFKELEKENSIIEEKYKKEREILLNENNHFKINKDLYESQINELQNNLMHQKEFYDKLLGKIGIDEELQLKNDQNRIDLINEKQILEETIRNYITAHEGKVCEFTKTIQEYEIDKIALKKEIQILKEELAIAKKSTTEFFKPNNKEDTEIRHETESIVLGDFNQDTARRYEIEGRKFIDIILDNEQKLKEINKLKEKELLDIIKSNDELKKLIEDQKNYYENILINEKKTKENLLKDFENREKELLNNIKQLQSNLGEIFKNENIDKNNNIFHLNQKVKSLENYIQELKENNFKLVSSNNETIQRNFDNFKAERNEFLRRIDDLNKDLLIKSELIMTLEMTLEQINKNFKEKEESLYKCSKSTSYEINELKASLELYKKKCDEYCEELIIKKQEYSRENSLLKQQIEFLNKNTDYLKKNINENQTTFESTLLNLRSEIGNTYEDKLEKVLNDKKCIEENLSEKKKEIREIKTNYIKKLTSQEKEIEILNEKIQTLEKCLKDQIPKSEQEEKFLNHQRRFDNKPNLEEFINTIDQLKKNVKILENQLEEKANLYDKEKIVYESKIKYLENLKDQVKTDYVEAQKKFDKSIELLNKKLKNEKEKREDESTLAINDLSLKHQKDLKKLNEENNILRNELKDINKQFETELKNIDAFLRNYEVVKGEIDNLKKEFIIILHENNRLRVELEISKKSEYSISNLKDNRLIFSELKYIEKKVDEKSVSPSVKLRDDLNYSDRNYSNLIKVNELIKNDKNNLFSQYLNKSPINSIRTQGSSNTNNYSSQSQDNSNYPGNIYSKSIVHRSSISNMNKSKNSNISPIRESEYNVVNNGQMSSQRYKILK